MRLVAVENIKPGTILSKSIHNESGQILIGKDVKLTERMIQRLIDLGITFIYIDDPHTKDIEPTQSISDELRKNALKQIDSCFNVIQQEDWRKKSFLVEHSTKDFYSIIRKLIFELKNNKSLLSLLADIYTHDNYLLVHSLNVTLYSLAIGVSLKLSEKQLETLGIGAMYHDIGKLSVPKEILSKPNKLTTTEFELVKKHTEFGFDILRNANTLPLLVAHCAYQHHERLDGSGYPRGIKEDQIHLFGKIIAVADVFDAVTSNRVYRSAVLPHDGMEILYAGSGTLFNTTIIKAFRQSVVIYPEGLTVVLSNDAKGVVARQNIGLGERPVIRVLEEKGKILNKPYEIDLKKELHIMIVECDTTMVNQFNRFELKSQLNKE